MLAFGAVVLAVSMRCVQLDLGLFKTYLASSSIEPCWRVLAEQMKAYMSSTVMS